MNKPTPEWVSDCCGDDYYFQFIRYVPIWDKEDWECRCSKCNNPCTPVESGGSREKGESDE